MKRLAFLSVLLVSFAQAEEIVIRTGLGIRVPGARRSAVHVDPIEHKIVIGSWKSPTEGQEGWTKVSANEKGEFSGGPTGGGYVYSTLESASERIVFLEASGHSLVYVNGVPRTGDPYSYGYVSLPIELKKGKNEFLFLCGRGRLSAKLVDAPQAISMDLRDTTLP
ncbi:MAG: hypothetical protein H7Y17_00855, partial [Chlorobia bacterium]|nr:hypothetical protein [Fimbriimonadaceae bacterium]